jgi:hypothetical protein
VYPGLALAAVAAATGARERALRIANVNASVLTIDNRTVQVDGRSNLLLRYRGKKRTFPYFSAADVLTDQVPAGALRDKIVFVGTTALGTREVVCAMMCPLRSGEVRSAHDMSSSYPLYERGRSSSAGTGSALSFNAERTSYRQTAPSHATTAAFWANC